MNEIAVVQGHAGYAGLVAVFASPDTAKQSIEQTLRKYGIQTCYWDEFSPVRAYCYTQSGPQGVILFTITYANVEYTILDLA